MSLLYQDESYAIRGAAMEVMNTLGSGFTEYVYQDALEVEFKRRNIPYEREKNLKVVYKGVELKHDYFADFVCYGNIIVEIKAVKAIAVEHKAQLLNYLHACHKQLGLLINFGEKSLVTERLINTSMESKTTD